MASRIYTRAGDDGKTQLVGGLRVAKDHARVEAYGCLDELNAALGLARALARRETAARPAMERLEAVLVALQGDLFGLSAVVASPCEREQRGPSPEALERWIDELDGELPPLRQFILPGGAPLEAQLHVARTVCRRAERRIVVLTEAWDRRALRYVNRSSDLLFVLARWAAQALQAPEQGWSGPPS